MSSAAASPPEPVFTVLKHSFYLEQFFPVNLNIFNIVAISIMVVFLIRGICD